MSNRMKMLLVALAVSLALFAFKSMAGVPRFNIDPYSHHYTADQSFAGDVSVTGDVTMSGAFSPATVTSEVYQSAATGGNDDMIFKPAGTLGMTLAENGNLTVVGAVAGSNLSGSNTGDQTITLTGAVTGSGTGSFATTFNPVAVFPTSVSTPIILSPATGGADDIDMKPATVSVFKVTEAGEVQLTKPVTAHSACAAAGDVGRIDVFSVGDTKSFCGCWQSGAGTYAWVGLHAGAVCS